MLFFFRVECNYSTVYMYHTFLSQLSVDGHSGCLHVLADSAVMNIGVHVSFWISVFVFSRYMPRSRVGGSYGSNTEQSLVYNCSWMCFQRDEMDSILVDLVATIEGHMTTSCNIQGYYVQSCIITCLLWHMINSHIILGGHFINFQNIF